MPLLLEYPTRQWNAAATGVLFHCWACQLNECMISSLEACNVKCRCNWCTLSLFSLRNQSNACKCMCTLRSYSAMTQRQSNCIYGPFKHTGYVVTTVVWKANAKGSKPAVCCTDIENRSMTPMFMSCIICTSLTTFRVLVAVSTNTLYAPTMIAA